MDDAPPNRWVRHLAALCARTVLATVAGLLVWTVLPAAIGWQPTVVVSGSMEPAIGTGDVVLTRRVPADQLRPGHVLLVDDPTGTGRLLLHRFDSTNDDGGIVLRGDANEAADSTPVTADAVHGVGVLRVPWVGLPYVWVAQGTYLPLALTVLALAVCLLLSPIRERTGRRRAPGRAVSRLGWSPVAAATLLAIAVPGLVAADARTEPPPSVTLTTTGPAEP